MEDEEYVTVSVVYGAHLKYAVKDQMALHFDLCDGKLYQITALKRYRGKDTSGSEYPDSLMA